MENSFFKYVVFLFFMVLSFNSCTDNIISNNVEELGVNLNMRTTSVLVNTTGRYYVNNDNALVFASVDDYFFVTDSLLKLTDEEFYNWETNIQFESYRSILDRIFSEIVNSDMDESLIEKYSKYIIKNKEGDIEPYIKAQSYTNVLNGNGVFYIGETKHVVDKEYVSIIDLNEKSRNVHRFQYAMKQMQMRDGDAIEYPQISSDARENRKVFTWFNVYRNIAGSNGLDKNTIDLDIVVRPRKCVNWVLGTSWKDYNDLCYVDELRVHMPGIGGNFVIDENNNWIFKQDEFWWLSTHKSSKSTSRYTITCRLNSTLLTSTDRLQDIVCIHYRARTGDAGKYGAAYNVFHPLPGMTDCGHRNVTSYQHTQY